MKEDCSINIEELIIAPCSYEASKFACENFHYSHNIPPSKLVRHGVWENGLFIGSIIYGDSTNFNIGSPYGLQYTEICELERVALSSHTHPVTEMLSKSLKLLHEKNPNLQLVVSYADANQEHTGVIYQASNWIYEGVRPSRYVYIVNGERLHGKTVHDRYGRSDLPFLRENVDENVRTERLKGKHKYIYPLTRRARKQFSYLATPYPKNTNQYIPLPKKVTGNYSIQRTLFGEELIIEYEGLNGEGELIRIPNYQPLIVDDNPRLDEENIATKRTPKS